jgi:uncharacterized Tic20 family protein
MESTPSPESQIPADVGPAEERTWAMLAHLSTLLNLISGVLGVVAALIIYLMYKDRSRYVAYQSLQSLVFQLVFWLGGSVLVVMAWTFSGVLSAVVIGICCMPFALILSIVPLAAIVYGVIGGIQCNQGQDFQYWLVGEWVRGTLTG